MAYPIYLDIETIPTQSADVRKYIATHIAHPGNIRNPETIAKWNEESRPAAVEEAVNKTGLDGAFGQIVCIGFDMQDDGESNSFSGMDEALLLGLLNNELTQNVRLADQVQVTIVGHNVASFDLRFLLQRYIVNGIRPHPIIWRAARAKPWESDRVYDTMVQFAGVGNRISLDKLCLALGIEGKGMTTGADVWPMVQEGRLNDVARYCENDVAITRAAYRRMTFQDAP